MKRTLLFNITLIILLSAIVGCSFVNPISVNDKGVFTKQAVSVNLIVPDSANPVQAASVILHWDLNQSPTYDSIKILSSNRTDSSNFIFTDEVAAEKVGTFVDTLNNIDFNGTYFFKLQSSDGEELNVYSIEFLHYLNIYSPLDTVSSNDFIIAWNKIVGTITNIHIFLLNGSDTTTVWNYNMVIDDTTAIDTMIQFNSDSTASDTLVTGKVYNIVITTTRGDATTIGSRFFYKN